MSFDSLNRSGLAMVADPETLIADRGGADSMYAKRPSQAARLQQVGGSRQTHH